MRPPRIFSKDIYYHLMTKGNNQNIFINKRDFNKFAGNLDNYSRRFSVEILCFVLMTNHIHLLVKQLTDVPLSKFMQVLTTSYANYFNIKHKRSGHLFEARFKSIAVDSDEYLIHLSRYIHLNPSSAGLTNKPEEYYWSSYRYYLGVENFGFINKKTVLSFFSSDDPTSDYKEFVDSRINYQKEISLQKTFLE